MPNEDANDTSTETPEGEGTAAPSPDQTGSDGSDAIASARKRQAGAEAARQAAEAKLAEAQKELETYRSQNQTASEKELSEVARLTERVNAAEKRASEAEAKAEARILDARFPNARKELPEVTDEVRLAKFEAMLRDDDGEANEAPTPRGQNVARRDSVPTGGREAKEQTSADILAQLEGMELPPEWGGPARPN